MEHVCVCQSSSIHVCSHGACRCMGVSFIERKASDKRATAAAKATEPQPRGCQELGGRPGKARYWGPDHVDKHKHTHTHKRKYTYTHTHTHTYTRTRTEPFHSSSFTSPPSVLVTAIRPCHRLSSLSLPFVHVTAFSPPFVLFAAFRRHSSPLGSRVLVPAAASSLHGQRSVEMPTDDTAISPRWRAACLHGVPTGGCPAKAGGSVLRRRWTAMAVPRTVAAPAPRRSTASPSSSGSVQHGGMSRVVHWSLSLVSCIFKKS